MAALVHCINFHSENNQYRFCQQGECTWCKQQRYKLKEINYYKKKLNLPVATYTETKGILQDLSKDDLSHKYLHGETQKTNEAFSQLIWETCPKFTFVSKKFADCCKVSCY